MGQGGGIEGEGREEGGKVEKRRGKGEALEGEGVKAKEVGRGEAEVRVLFLRAV